MSLTIFFGPMFSGKTTKHLEELTRFVDVSDKPCLLVNHTFDNRDFGVGDVSSHNSSFKGVSHKITTLKISHLRDVDISGYDIIGIDESQFFDDLYEIVKLWVSKDKNVVISGLISDAFMKPFGEIYKLIPCADKVVQVHSICKECLSEYTGILTPDILNSMKSPFTMRIAVGVNQIEVGFGIQLMVYPLFILLLPVDIGINFPTAYFPETEGEIIQLLGKNRFLALVMIPFVLGFAILFIIGLIIHFPFWKMKRGIVKEWKRLERSILHTKE
jgi:thymidine kinase